MERTDSEARTRRWQRVMVGVILFGIVFRVVMQVYGPLEAVYQYILSVPYVAFAALVFFDTEIRRQKGFRILLLCLAWAILTSCFHTYDFNGITHLLPYFLMMFFGFFLCYPMAFILPEEDAKKAFAAIAAAFMAGVTLLCAVGIYTAVARVMIANPAGGQYEPCGVVFGRLSIFAYPTMAAVFCGLALLLTVFLFLKTSRKLLRALCVLAGVIQFVAMALTGGRIATVFLCACFGGVGYLLAASKLKIQKNLPRVAAALCVAAAVMSASYLGASLSVRAVNAISAVAAPKTAAVTVTMLSEAPKAPETVVSEAALPEKTGADTAEDGGDVFDDEEKFATETKNRSLFENISTLQGRTYAWEGAIRALLDDPMLLLLGASPVYVMERVDPFVPPNTEAEGFIHLHSIYFQTLVAFGLPGFLLFAAMLAYLLYHAVRVFFIGTGCSMAERMLPLLLVFCLGVDLLEVFLTFSDVMKMSNPWFFLTAGYVVFLSETRIPKKAQKARTPAAMPEGR